MAQLRGQLFGQGQIWRDGVVINDFGYDKVRALLIFLWVEADRPHHRDELATLLWPDTSDSRARTNLRKALSTLRRTIGDHEAQPPLLHITRDTIQFNASSISSLDVTTFRTHMAYVAGHDHTAGELCFACAQRLDQATKLYQSDFLCFTCTSESAGFAEWATTVREELHQQVVDALAVLAAYDEQRGALEAAQRSLRHLLAIEPWDEAAHRSLMRVLAKRGQRGAALQQFERCRHVLGADLGLEPEAATVALREQICSGALLARVA